MKVIDLLQRRRNNWQELEQLCGQMESRSGRALKAETIARFAALYRSVCADLALADAYQLPPNTVQFLHRLVGRAHNQLYRSRPFELAAWGPLLLQEIPQRMRGDRCLQVACLLFWGVFLLSACLAHQSQRWPNYAQQMLSDEMLEMMQASFSEPIGGRDASLDPIMASYYIQHNTAIGLQCFAGGLLVIPGLLVTIFNSAHLGAVFGYMARPDVPEGPNFFHFVTAHGPFELTAIVLSAGAGLRLGVSWIRTAGLSRAASLQTAARQAMPLMGAAMILFFLAALIEGFLSPSPAPYWIKAATAILSTGLLIIYFGLAGSPRGRGANQWSK